MAKATTVMLLSGIRTAANKGDKFPETAKERPTTLYKNEIIKLVITMERAVCEKLTNWLSL